MDAEKIREFIEELREDIRIKETAIASLMRLLPSNGPERMVFHTSDNIVLTDNLSRTMFSASDSYVDLAVKLIESNQRRPMPVSLIVENIRTLKSDPNIERRSVEATLHQHVTKAASPRLAKIKPGIYALTMESEGSAA